MCIMISSSKKLAQLLAIIGNYSCRILHTLTIHIQQVHGFSPQAIEWVVGSVNAKLMMVHVLVREMISNKENVMKRVSINRLSLSAAFDLPIK